MQIELSLSSSVMTIFVFPLTKSVRNSFVIANAWSFFFQKNLKTDCQLFLCLSIFNKLNMSLKLTSIILIELE